MSNDNAGRIQKQYVWTRTQTNWYRYFHTPDGGEEFLNLFCKNENEQLPKNFVSTMFQGKVNYVLYYGITWSWTTETNVKLVTMNTDTSVFIACYNNFWNHSVNNYIQCSYRNINLLTRTINRNTIRLWHWLTTNRWPYPSLNPISSRITVCSVLLPMTTFRGLWG